MSSDHLGVIYGSVVQVQASCACGVHEWGQLCHIAALGYAMQYCHTFSGIDDCIHFDDAMRLIAHHLLHFCSGNGAFNLLESVVHAAPLLAAKKELA